MCCVFDWHSFKQLCVVIRCTGNKGPEAGMCNNLALLLEKLSESKLDPLKAAFLAGNTPTVSPDRLFANCPSLKEANELVKILKIQPFSSNLYG